jgi:hypothetical protein
VQNIRLGKYSLDPSYLVINRTVCSIRQQIKYKLKQAVRHKKDNKSIKITQLKLEILAAKDGKQLAE